LGTGDPRVPHRADHRVLLYGAGDEVPPRRGCGSVHAQSVRHPLRDLPRRLRRPQLRHHLGVDGIERLRREPRGRLRLGRLGHGVMWIALGFLTLIAAVNLRGVGESVWFNVVLTLIELSGLLLVILVGFFAFGSGDADFSRVMIFETEGDKSVFLAVTGATALAFFSMVGFEDSVNMVEETTDPSVFPKIMLSGLTITGVIYVLVSIVTVAAVPIGVLTESETPLLEVVRAGAPGVPIDTIFPFMTMFAVANSALINML